MSAAVVGKRTTDDRQRNLLGSIGFDKPITDCKAARRLPIGRKGQSHRRLQKGVREPTGNALES